MFRDFPVSELAVYEINIVCYSKCTLTERQIRLFNVLRVSLVLWK
jgi:hypothetical protein